jgi:hypothetical protein
MDQLVVGVQTPVASSQKKKGCGICGSEFSKQSNLKRHIETKHKDQNTPEAVAKCLKLKEYRKNTRRERRANDPVYREKMQKINRTYKMQVKARMKACAMGGTDADASSASINEPSTDASSASINEPSTDAHEPPTDAPELDNRHGGGIRVKNAKSVKPADVLLRVETTALTTAGVISFFTPKYDAPRSKEQRAANPRPSAI